MKVQQISAVGTLDVLVVDAERGTGELVRKGISARGGRVRVATSVDQALAEMKNKPADVLLVNVQINDNGGLGLIRTVREKYPKTQSIAMSRVRRSEACLEAWRAGAADMLIAPYHAADIERAVGNLFGKRTQVDQLVRRNQRLRQVCKQLNKARHDISRQVDLLCNDLVRAYQEMAQQLNLTQMTVDFCQAAGNEIEVEGLLRKTMEWVLQKLGPVNAAVYLSDAEHRFALGAYLNLDTQADAELIHAIGETIVKESDGSSHALAVEDDATIDAHFGEQGERLKGRTWLSAPCYTATAARRECLAVLVIFRSQVDSSHSGGGEFDPSVRLMIEGIAPILGEKIEQALELYHRMHPEGEDESESEYEE